MDIAAIKFDEKELVPAIAQDAESGEVLMLAYMNAESLQQTMATGLATYYSRSRNELWVKGATSGHYQRVRSMAYDCDGDAILMKVEQTGAACHTGHRSCFFNELPLECEAVAVDDATIGADSSILEDVYAVVEDRKVNPVEGSYTNYLFTKGVEKICKKVGEEASETIIAAVKGSNEELRYEAADLMYHLMVLLSNQGLTPADVFGELRSRRK